MAMVVWNGMNSKDVRNVIDIAKLVHSVDDVSWLVQTYKKYRRIPEVGNSVDMT
jgi:hypothetical protein